MPALLERLGFDAASERTSRVLAMTVRDGSDTSTRAGAMSVSGLV